ncbi:MFS transporter [Actinomyces faecalis]|uniref:MFS transporter n=1 Tax=Actinomyces faecalis TaxID=2722820 RepID=UPI0015542514|nr:MFS transporter [Actinomyces faecalis]
MADHGHDGGLGVYVSLLRLPHASRSVISGVIGQFPFPFLGMGLLIGIRDGYGSYTLAGVVSSVMALTSAFTGPVVGRLIDTYGQRRVGLPLAGFWIFSILFMSAALHLHWPSWVIVAGGVLLGTSVPYSSMIRGRWTYVLRKRPGQLNSALSLTSTLEEMMWVIGNPTATVLATSVAMLSPMAAAVVAILISIWGFLLDDAIEPPPTGRPRRRAAPAEVLEDVAEAAPAGKEQLFTIGFVALLAIQVAYGAFIASTSVSVVALSAELGTPGRAGLVIACFSGASMLGAVGYGARVWTSPLWIRFYVGMTVVAAGSALLLFTHSLASASAVLFVAGLAQAPTVVNVNQLLISMTPSSRFTEAMAMLGAMFVIGMAASNLLTGRMVDVLGSHGGMLSLAGFAVSALVIGLIAMRPIRKATTLPSVPKAILEGEQ